MDYVGTVTGIRGPDAAPRILCSMPDRSQCDLEVDVESLASDVQCGNCDRHRVAKTSCDSGWLFDSDLGADCYSRPTSSRIANLAVTGFAFGQKWIGSPRRNNFLAMDETAAGGVHEHKPSE